MKKYLTAFILALVLLTGSSLRRKPSGLCMTRGIPI